MMQQKEEHPFSDYLDLAAAKLGGKVLYANDDFFAEKENLIQEGRGIFIADKYTERGKWMDGWESRRRRTPGEYDWCVIQLAVPGMIKGVDIDTNHFLGNHPPFAGIDGANLATKPLQHDLHVDRIDWTEILPKSPLNPGSQHYFEVNTDKVWTHLKLRIYPDGGVARLKVYGEVHKQRGEQSDKIIDLVAAVNGGKAIACNDMFFSRMDNLIMPGKGVNMGDGWETKRNRTPNNRDWVILRLTDKGRIKQIVVDTHHFKGNYPDMCSLEGCNVENDKMAMDEKTEWKTILNKMKLRAHAEHYFEKEVMSSESFSHVRLNIFPDGGVSRLRLYGIAD